MGSWPYNSQPILLKETANFASPPIGTVRSSVSYLFSIHDIYVPPPPFSILSISISRPFLSPAQLGECQSNQVSFYPTSQTTLQLTSLVAGQAGLLSMHSSPYTPFPLAYAKKGTQEYLTNQRIATNVIDYPTNPLPSTALEHEQGPDNIPYMTQRMDHSEYHKHQEHYVPVPVHDFPSYPSSVDSFLGRQYDCSDHPRAALCARSGSFSSISSIGSASSISSSHSSDYATSHNLSYLHQMPHHSQSISFNTSIFSVGIDQTQQPEPVAPSVDPIVQPISIPSLPAPAPNPPHYSQTAFQSRSSLSEPTRPRLFEPPQFTSLGVEQQQYSSTRMNPIPFHQPQPHHFIQVSLLNDESPHLSMDARPTEPVLPPNSTIPALSAGIFRFIFWLRIIYLL